MDNPRRGTPGRPDPVRAVVRYGTVTADAIQAQWEQIAPEATA
ncbi:hypothetical protein [Nocardiopsis sp. HUAS JQ3]|nr:hypothetical protein [Nocardiopsis sp. HUAS JQ3]WDZ88299.1 hypothetical protein PV789_15040 [Nocardiopsis sp. HUAS JQ3]